MRYPPRYPEIPPEKPIKWKAWSQGLLVVVASALLITNLFWPEDQSIKTPLFWSVSLIFPSILWAFILFCYLFINKLVLYNRTLYSEAFEADEIEWWKYQSVALPIERVIIIGSLGGKQYPWAMLVRNKPIPPISIKEEQATTLPCPLLIGDKQAREKMLAELLVNELVNLDDIQKQEWVISHIFWLGTQDSLNIFIASLEKNSIKPVINQILIKSINALDDIIDTYYQESDRKQIMLIAGTNLYDTVKKGPLAETAFLWQVGDSGKFAVHRCETTADITVDLTSQLMKYAALTQPPEITVAMDQQSAFAFSPANWHGTENILAPYYGGISLSSPFLAISQLTMHCIQNNIEHGSWVSSSLDEQYIAGVIAQYEQQ